MRDVCNREIKVNDLVAYPGRKKSQAWLQLMRVDEVLPDRIGGYLSTGRHAQVWGNTLKHVAILRHGATLEGAAERRRELAAAN